MTDTEFESPQPKGISRRTVTKAMAWSVPAVAVASAVPAYALSGNPPTIQILAACKQPGESCDTPSQPWGFIKGYIFLVRLVNNGPKPIYLYTPAQSNTASDTNLTPFFRVTSSVPFDFFYTRYATVTPGQPVVIGGPIGTELMIPGNSSLYILVNAGTNDNSQQTDAIGDLFIAWGHTTPAGSDVDHPYVPNPHVTSVGLPNTSPVPHGPGWLGGSFSFASTPPCDDCTPANPS